MIKKRKIDIFLVFILVLSAALNLYGIWNSDTDNAYYTAAVESMTQSFHNFFYASFDPAGFVTVDKPPVALWIQTLFALVFGVHGWSVVLSEAIAEVISVALLYFIVKPTFGKTAARISGSYYGVYADCRCGQPYKQRRQHSRPLLDDCNVAVV